MLSHIRCTFANKRSRYDLTKDVYERLPREIRDIICQYLFTPVETSRPYCTWPIQVRRPYNNLQAKSQIQRLDDTQIPDFAIPGTVYEPFAFEVVEAIYALHQNLCIDIPSDITAFMDADFFGIGCTPRQASISGLSIYGAFDAGRLDHSQKLGFINLETLEADFEDLLDCKWGRGLQLNIHFRISFGDSSSETTSQDVVRSIASTLLAVWHASRSFLEEARRRGAQVRLEIKTYCKVYYYTNGEHNMLDTEEEWAAELRRSLNETRYLLASKRPPSLRIQHRKHDTLKFVLETIGCGCWFFCCCCAFACIPKRWLDRVPGRYLP